MCSCHLPSRVNQAVEYARAAWTPRVPPERIAVNGWVLWMASVVYGRAAKDYEMNDGLQDEMDCAPRRPSNRPTRSQTLSMAAMG